MKQNKIKERKTFYNAPNWSCWLGYLFILVSLRSNPSVEYEYFGIVCALVRTIWIYTLRKKELTKYPSHCRLHTDGIVDNMRKKPAKYHRTLLPYHRVQIYLELATLYDAYELDLK